MLKNEDFIELTIRIRLLEKKLLTKANITRIIEAPNATEALRQISQHSEYDFSSLKKAEDYEAVVKEHIEGVYALMYGLSPDSRVVDIPAAKYGYHNLKTLLKSKHSGKDANGILSPVCALDLSKDDLPPHITAAWGEAEAAYLKTADPQSIDVVLDRHMFARMLALCEELKSDFITEYTRLSIDVFNIKTLLRVKGMKRGARFLSECMAAGGLTDKQLLLSYYDKEPGALSLIAFCKYYFGDIIKNGLDSHSKAGNFAALDKLFDDYLVEFSKKSKYYAFGPEVLFAYIISKENEIRQIRILMSCKLNDIRADIIRERLRDNYV